MINEDEVLKEAADNDIRYIRLQFVDILGRLKDVEIPVEQLSRALREEIMFDGSSVEGFVTVEESDMRLAPDPDTLTILPWKEESVARMICDVKRADGSFFEGCPRSILKKTLAEAEEKGFSYNVGPEPEFFLFRNNDKGQATTLTSNEDGYCDEIIDKEEKVLRGIAENLKKLDFEIEALHQENAPGQYEIVFKYADALTTADKVITFKTVVRAIAHQHKLHATFMPKPFADHAGSCMHIHQSLFKDGQNVFYAEDDEEHLSETARHFIGGQLAYAREFSAITNPIVNSYKRLGSGFEAPLYVAWSMQNRTSLIRVPAAHSKVGTRVELRSPDATCNPYLALAVILKAGLKGIEEKINPPVPLNGNNYELESNRVKSLDETDKLPRDLGEALHLMNKSSFMRDTVGSHVHGQFIDQKTTEWDSYCSEIHPWEINTFLSEY
jgi:glutamine synthetase